MTPIAEKFIAEAEAQGGFSVNGFLIVTKRGLWPFPEYFLKLFQLGKVQKFPASFSSSELSARQMAPSGVIPHWRSHPALQAT